jgi:hypothetical protein
MNSSNKLVKKAKSPYKKSSKTSNKKSSKTSNKKSSKTDDKKSSKADDKIVGSSQDSQKIMESMEKLSTQLKEKELHSFWVFPENGFKKKIRKSYADIEKMVKIDFDNGVDRKNIVDIRIIMFHNKPNSISGKAGILIGVSIAVYPIKDGKVLNKKSYGVNPYWKIHDLKISKMTLKLLEHLMELTLKHKLSIVGVFGVPFHELIERMKYKKINISKFLSPMDF